MPDVSFWAGPTGAGLGRVPPGCRTSAAPHHQRPRPAGAPAARCLRRQRPCEKQQQLRWVSRAAASDGKPSGQVSSRESWNAWWFEARNHEALETLLGMPHADVNATLPTGMGGDHPGGGNKTALMLACLRGDATSVRVLLAAGAELNSQRDTNGCAAVHYAAAFGNLACLEALVAAGADLDAQDLQGSSPAILAACGRHGEVLAALVAAGCDLSLMDSGNATVAGHCAFNGLTRQLVEILVAAGPGGAVKPRRGSKHYRALRKQLERQLQALSTAELRQVAAAWDVKHKPEPTANELVTILTAAHP